MSGGNGNCTDRVSRVADGRAVSDHLTVTSLRTSLRLVLVALFAAPAAAGAAVTATSISEPATDPSVFVYVEPTGLTLKVSGTSNGGVGRLDLRCEGAANPVAFDNVRPTAAASGRRRLGDPGQRLTPRTCYLHAVPHGNAGTNRTAFPGKRIMVQRSRVTAVIGGPNNGVPDDFRYWAPQLLGRSIWQSVSNCGLSGASTIAPDTFRVSGSAFPCAGFIAPSTAGRAGVLVDHVNAFMPYGAATLFPGSANALGLLASQTSVATDPSTGNVLIRETENLLRCSPDPATLVATALTCSSFVSAGVKLDRVIVQQGTAGRHSSATPGPHRRPSPRDRRLLRGPAGRHAPVVSFPWAGGFTSYPPDFTQKPPPTAPFSIFTRASPECPRRRRHNPQGAITLQDRPTSLRFRTGRAWTQYVRTLTPETPTRISVRLLVGHRGRTRDADRPGRARTRADPLPRPEPRRQATGRCEAPVLAGHCKVGKIKRATSKVRRKDRVIRQGRRPAPRCPAAAASRCWSARA